jgi:GTP-binding protein LepA
MLREALDKLQLNDAALVFEPENSAALGFGFRCGFLGLLHMEIVRERLEREAGLALISTAPNVVYRVTDDAGKELIVTNPSEFPDGKIMKVVGTHCAGNCPRASRIYRRDHGALPATPRNSPGKWIISPKIGSRFDTLPLAEIVFDFFDQLKSRTRGYASLDYEPVGEAEGDPVKVDILLQGEKVDAFSAIVHPREGI